MNILAVDTAGKTLGVALLQDDRLLYEVYLDAGMTHSETLMPMIDTCLKTCGMTCADIDLYGVNAGPGSFTGLRIGLAAVKGLAFPRETLCAPVSTLEALAALNVAPVPPSAPSALTSRLWALAALMVPSKLVSSASLTLLLATLSCTLWAASKDSSPFSVTLAPTLTTALVAAAALILLVIS